MRRVAFVALFSSTNSENDTEAELTTRRRFVLHSMNTGNDTEVVLGELKTRIVVSYCLYADALDCHDLELTMQEMRGGASVALFFSTNSQNDTEAELTTRKRVRAGMFGAIKQTVGDDAGQTTEELEQVLQATASISGATLCL